MTIELAGLELAALELADLGDWIWQRHHNVLSWYIRPLFLLPLALTAYRRSGPGIAITLAALVTSMFWFPAPAVPDPHVDEFLAFERDWLTGDWNTTKVALTLLVPSALAAYCTSFWRRSFAWGIVVLNMMAVGKLTWGVAAGAGTGWAMAAPALLGLAVGDAVLIWAASRRRRAGQNVTSRSQRRRRAPISCNTEVSD